MAAPAIARKPEKKLLRAAEGTTREEFSLEVAVELVRDIEAGKLEVPPLPRTTIELSRLVRSESSSLTAVVNLVERDIQLAARVLRMASSAAFGAAKVADLRNAIMRIGMAGVRNISMSMAVASSFRAGVLEPYLKLETRHAYVTACGAAALTQRLGGDPQHGFLCGLMHDVGCSTLIATVAKRGTRTPAVMALDLLIPLLDQLHTDVGHKVLGLWGLADSVREVAQVHHLAHRQAQPSPAMVGVALADAADERSGTDRLKMLLEHPIRNLVEVGQSDLERMLKVMDEAGNDEALSLLLSETGAAETPVKPVARG